MRSSSRASRMHAQKFIVPCPAIAVQSTAHFVGEVIASCSFPGVPEGRRSVARAAAAGKCVLASQKTPTGVTHAVQSRNTIPNCVMRGAACRSRLGFFAISIASTYSFCCGLRCVVPKALEKWGTSPP